MANPLKPQELIAIPAVDYQQIRPTLKTGDLVFCSGGYFFSKIIQRLTKSTWSHVGIIYRDEALDRVLILESETLIGVRFIPVSKYLKDYKETCKPYIGKMLIAKIDDANHPPEMKAGISFGLDQLAQPYDNWEIIRIMLRILFRIGKPNKNRNYICSELVRDILTHAGMVIPLDDTYISPDDLWKLDSVKMDCRIL